MPKIGEELTERLLTVEAYREAAFANVSKAHRRVRILQRDWGLQACRVHPGRLRLNKVGTYGVASIAYWLARLVAAMGGGVLYMMMRLLVGSPGRCHGPERLL